MASATLEQLVIIGGGMAAARLVREVLVRDPDAFEITVVSAEATACYDRIQLSSVLAGQRQQDDLDLLTEAERGAIRLIAGCRAASIDPTARNVTLDDGRKLAFDALVLATGSQPFMLPLPGHEAKGVVTFRDLDDVEHLMRAKGRAIVIGGGLLGLEAAHGLRSRGLEVTTVHLMPWLMERQLDCEAGALLRRTLEAQGHRFELESQSEAIVVTDQVEGLAVEGLELADGRILPADLIVMAVGIRPNTSLACETGLDVGRGVIVDDGLQTSIAGIYAIGECAEHQGSVYGLVWPAYEQAAILARNLCGQPAAYGGSTVFTSLKVSGVDVFSAGRFGDDVAAERIFLRDPGRQVYRKLMVENDRLIGAVLVGDASDGAWYADLIDRRVDISAFRSKLMFGRAYLSPSDMAA